MISLNNPSIIVVFVIVSIVILAFVVVVCMKCCGTQDDGSNKRKKSKCRNRNLESGEPNNKLKDVDVRTDSGRKTFKTQSDGGIEFNLYSISIDKNQFCKSVPNAVYYKPSFESNSDDFKPPALPPSNQLECLKIDHMTPDKKMYNSPQLTIRAKKSPSPQVYETVPWPGTWVGPPAPLQNKTENCYLNAVTQALAACSFFIHDLKILRESYSSKLLLALINLLEALNTKRAQEEFQRFVQLSGWSRTGHQDAYEMMCYIFNSVYKQIEVQWKSVNRSDSESDSRLRSRWLREILPFRCFLTNDIQCTCERKSEVVQTYLGLQLPLTYSLSNNHKLEEMLQIVLNESEIDDPCEKCNSDQKLVMGFAPGNNPPNSLVLHIQANTWNFEFDKMEKPKYTIEFPFKLQTKSLCNIVYDLVALVEHSGGVSVGHYIAYRRVNQEWFHTDDNCIEIRTKEEVLQNCRTPYLLLYELQEQIQPQSGNENFGTESMSDATIKSTGF